MKVSEAIRDGAVSPLSKTPKNWRPAAEIRGEGIFVRFRTQAIDDWIAANPALNDRVAVLEASSAAMAQKRGYTRDYRVTARLLLVHSFAHALMHMRSTGRS